MWLVSAICDSSDQLLVLIEGEKACPSVYHEFEGPDPIPYDVEGMIHSLTGEGLPHDSGIVGTDRGNNYKVGARKNRIRSVINYRLSDREESGSV